MSKLLRSLLAATAFLTLAPTAALALPPQCAEICWEFGDCDVTCAVNSRITTCGAAGMCFGARAEPSEASASVSQDEARQSEASQVCGEEQAAEPSASAET